MRVEGSSTFVSLNSRLESNKEEEKVRCLLVRSVRGRLKLEVMKPRVPLHEVLLAPPCAGGGLVFEARVPLSLRFKDLLGPVTRVKKKKKKKKLGLGV